MISLYLAIIELVRDSIGYYHAQDIMICITNLNNQEFQAKIDTLPLP